MVNGIINVYKEKGYTSHDVVAKLRGIFRQKKSGHTGTLDPDAEGVLPVCLGKATRVCDLLADKDKVYDAVLRLGIVTDTQDMTGQVQSEQEAACTQEELEETIRGFVGNYWQTPPMYSALKVNGKKLCDLARAGVEVERKPRQVTLYSIQIEEVSLPRVRMRVHCSKGTYVRTLCHDIGQKLGCGGAMSSLRRVRASSFSIGQAVSLEEIQRHENPLSLLLPVDSLFAPSPALTLEPSAEKKIRNGMTFSLPRTPEGIYRVYGQDQAFLALCRMEQGKLKTIKSFFEV